MAHGATVIGTASKRNHAFLTSLGATPTTYGPGLAHRLAALAPTGIDLALDTAASGSLPDLIAITGTPTRVATVADHANASRLGTHLANAENAPTLLAEAATLGRQGHYTPRVERTYRLDEMRDAHAYGERGRTRGKVVVRV